MDLALARTAASLEKLAVDTYQTGIDSGLVTTMAIADAATLFQSHHQEHLDALNGAISDAGGEEVTEPNEAVFEALIEPAVAAATAEADIVQIAFDLESAAAQTYVFAGGTLTVPDAAVDDHDDRRHRGPARRDPPGRRPGRRRRPTCSPADAGFYPGDNPLADIDGAVLSA